MDDSKEHGGSQSTQTVSAEPRPRGRDNAFAVGDLIGRRYRVIRFVARGAMGEVYAAEDHELGAVVALKTLRTERADDAVTLARFRREVLLARELAHPGICRTFDLGVHDGDGGRLVFLTMELLDGETLAARLDRVSRLDLPAALALAQKLVAALAVAHAAGVVHRDLKPANIMLVADERSGGERVVITDFGLARRAADAASALGPVLASAARAAGSGASDPRQTEAMEDEPPPQPGAAWASPAPGERATATGALLGSPAYMAPEQVTGRPIGPAADLYALGVVLFEVVTGRLPFEADTPLQVAAMRLERPAPRARSLRGELDPRWDDALARCLAREPADRFVRADELLRALTGPAAVPAVAPGGDEDAGAAGDDEDAAPPEDRSAGGARDRARPDAPAKARRSRRRPVVRGSDAEPSSSAGEPATLATATALSGGKLRRRRIATTTALAIGAVAAAIALRSGSRDGDEARQPARVPVAAGRGAPAEAAAPLLAVLPLRDVIGRADTAWLGTAAAEMLTTELGAGERLRVVPSDALAAAARARGVSLTAPAGAPAADASALGGALAADYLVQGSVASVGEPSAPRVRIDLEVRAIRGGQPPLRFGADGGQAELFQIVARLGEEVRARLGRAPLTPAERTTAAASQPTSPEAARELASGIAELRRYEAQKARAHFERAVALEPDGAKHHAALASAWRALQFPARTRAEAERAFELSAGLPRAERLQIEARHHEAARRFDQAIELYAALVAFFPESVEHRITLATAQADAGRPRDVLATVDRIRAAGGPGASDPRVDILEASAARATGDNERAGKAALAARARAAALGAPAMQAEAELAVCNVMGAQDLDQAREACGRAIEGSEKVGDRALQARALLQMAVVRERQNQVDEAAGLQARALAIYRELGNSRGVGIALTHRGNSLKSSGKLDEALDLLRQSLAATREAGDEFNASSVLTSISAVLVEKGELDQARRSYLETIDLARKVGNERGVAIALQNLAWVEHDGGQLLEARRHAEEAMAMQERRADKLDLVFSLDCAAIMALEQGDLDTADQRLVRALALRGELDMKRAPSLQNLAEVRLVQRRLDDARALIAQAIAAAAPGSLTEGFAREVEGRILLEAKDLAGAGRALARARELVGARSAAALVILEARLWTARGQPRKALALLPAALADARRRGALALRIALEGVQGEAELAAGDARGAERLAAVEKDAAARGFANMAREVAEIRARGAAAVAPR